jgi:hypothetical protein
MQPVLPSLLQSFTRLKLEIRYFAWHSLTPDIQKSLRTLTTLPSLVELEMNMTDFHKLGDFTSLLGPSLKQLTLSVRWRSDSLDVENEG